MTYHLKFLLALLLLVCAITGAAVVVAQRNAESTHRTVLEERFRNRVSAQLAAQEAQLAAIKGKCLSLARSVRLQAALEEDDLGDLHRIAASELHDVLRPGAVVAATAGASEPGEVSSPPLPRADFARFVDEHGTVLPWPPPEPGGLSSTAAATDFGAAAETLEAQLARLAPTLLNAPAARQVGGYLAVETAATTTSARRENGAVNPPPPVLEEVVITVIANPTTGDMLGALVLGFPACPPSGDTSVSEAQTGIWFGDRLFFPTPAAAAATPDTDALAEERASLAKRLSEFIRRAPEKPPTPGAPHRGAGHFAVELGGAPFLLFYQALHSSPPFAPAYQVCLYPLTESLRQQRALLGQIIAWGGLVLAGGFALSLLLARGLSAPVDRLAAGRQRAEEALRQSEEKFHRIFDNAVEGFYLAAADGRYVDMNPALARIYGYESPAEALAAMAEGSGIYVDRSRYAEFHRILQKDGIVTAFESEIERPDGSRLWVSENARVLRGADGGIVEYEGTLVDVSERKHAEAHLRALNARLESALIELKETQTQVIQQERLRALGEMASGIAHDFNNALMPILGFSELLLRLPAVLDERETALKYLQTINTSARDAGNVVSRLREFYRAREEDEESGPVDLAALITQAADLTQPKWKDQAQAAGITIELRTELPSDEDENASPLTVVGDESALREVLTNLIFNATDALPRGGTITLRARRETKGRKAWGVLEVSDTGVGMTDEVRRRCLDPFFSTKGERGTGLGLAMVFGIVQRHNGVLEIDSRPGAGSTFRVRLPLHLLPAATTTTTATAQPSLNGNGANGHHKNGHRALRVLVVDDEPQVRDTLAGYLQSDGHEFACVSDAREALAHFRDSAGDFDVIVTDQAMPGMSGEQFASAVKQLDATVPVILLTGFGCFLEAEEKRRCGVDVLASKPITLKKWRESLGRAREIKTF